MIRFARSPRLRYCSAAMVNSTPLPAARADSPTSTNKPLRSVSRSPESARPGTASKSITNDPASPPIGMCTLIPDYEVKKNRVLELYDLADAKTEPQRGDPTVVFCVDES